MNVKSLIGAGLLAATLGMGAASAAPLPGSALKADGVAGAGIVKVHGVHRACERGPAGWHRSLPHGGRIACRPAHPPGFYWSWRRNGNDWGWYHTRERRWH